MKRQSLQVLDQNLERLLQRCYTPVSVSPDFRMRLEHAWRAAFRARVRERATPRGRLLRFGPRLAGAVAAAVVLVLAGTFWFVGRDGGSDGPLGASELVARGDTALRFDGSDWRAATARELANGVVAARPLEVETPAGGGLAVRAGSYATNDTIEVQAETRAVIGRVDGQAGALHASLERGALTLARATDATEIAAPLVATTPAGALHLDVGRAELETEGMRDRVRLLEGRGTYVGPDGATPLAVGAELVLAGGTPLVADADPTLAGGSETARRTVDVPDAVEPEPEPEPVETVRAALHGSVRGLVGAPNESEDGAAEPRPLTSFRVALLEKSESNEYNVTHTRDFESADGGFLWDGIRADDYLVFVHADEHAIAKLGERRLEDGVTLDVGEVTLERGARVRGHVYDPSTGDPVPNAVVLSEEDAPVSALAFSLGLPVEAGSWEQAVEAWLPAMTKTRVDGSFELEHVSSGPQTLRITAPGYGPFWTKTRTLADGDEVDGLMIALEPGGSLEGHVTREDGTPWENAFVIVALMDELARPQLNFTQVITDAEGYYRADDLPAQPMLAILIGDPAAPGSPRVLPAMIESGRVTVVDFEDESHKTRVFGRIVDAEGRPMTTNMGVFPLDAEPAEAESEWKATTSLKDGSYVFEGLDPGEYMVVVIDARGMALSAVDYLDVPATGELEHDIRLGKLGIEGTCRSGLDGEPIGQCAVILEAVGWDGEAVFAGTTATDEDGAFHFTSIPSGLYRVTAYPYDGRHGYEQTAVLTIDEAQPVWREELVHLGAGTVDVSVVDPDGRPLAGAYVTLYDEAGRGFHFARQPVTDADGHYRANGVRPGRFRAEATLDGYADASVTFECRVANEHEVSIVMEPLTEDGRQGR